MSQLDIAKWSGRIDINQNVVYDHESDRDRNALVRQVLGNKTQSIAPIDTERKAMVIPRDQFGGLKLTTAHTTEYGYCRHDYTMLPCQLHRDCLNCTEQVCVKGEATKEANLRRIVKETGELLAGSLEAQTQGEFGADRWAAHQHMTLARAEQLLAIFDDPNVEDGAVIQLTGVIAASRIEQSVAERDKFDHNSSRNASPSQLLTHQVED